MYVILSKSFNFPSYHSMFVIFQHEVAGLCASLFPLCCRLFYQHLMTDEKPK